jgi:hypothetical protein
VVRSSAASDVYKRQIQILIDEKTLRTSRTFEKKELEDVLASRTVYKKKKKYVRPKYFDFDGCLEAYHMAHTYHFQHPPTDESVAGMEKYVEIYRKKLEEGMECVEKPCEYTKEKFQELLFHLSLTKEWYIEAQESRKYAHRL